MKESMEQFQLIVYAIGNSAVLGFILLICFGSPKRSSVGESLEIYQERLFKMAVMVFLSLIAAKQVFG